MLALTPRHFTKWHFSLADGLINKWIRFQTAIENRFLILSAVCPPVLRLSFFSLLLFSLTLPLYPGWRMCFASVSRIGRQLDREDAGICEGDYSELSSITEVSFKLIHNRAPQSSSPSHRRHVRVCVRARVCVRDGAVKVTLFFLLFTLPPPSGLDHFIGRVCYIGDHKRCVVYWLVQSLRTLTGAVIMKWWTQHNPRISVW